MDDNITITLDDSDDLQCQICHSPLKKLNPKRRQAHYDQHFEDNVETSPSEVIDLSGDTDTVANLKTSNKTTPGPQNKQNIFWHRSQDNIPPKNFTPSLITVLKQALLKSHGRGTTVRAALCYEGMVHVATEFWDLGWGCGNFLMACTALIDQQVQPLYFPALDQPTSPGVRNLQYWIEAAWKDGFDEEGASELGHNLVGTKKWIGTAELFVAFLHRGIPSKLVDFPRVASSADAVLQWIERYFTSPQVPGSRLMRPKVITSVDEALRGASPVLSTDRMPLILQHEGHSRTIVGFERLKNGSINLLCFDPSRKPHASIRDAAIRHFMSTRGESTKAGKHLGKHDGKISPSKIIKQILHPRHSAESSSSSTILDSKKRHVVDCDDTSARDNKRVRGGVHLSKQDVIVIDDAGEQTSEYTQGTSSGLHKKAKMCQTDKEPAYSKVLDFFRLKPTKVGKNDRYQILYFPLEDILTKEERWARRIVTSEIVR